MSDNVIEQLACATPTRVRIALAAISAHTYEDFVKLACFLETLERTPERRFFNIAADLLCLAVFEKIKADAVAYMAERDARNANGSGS